MTLPVNIVKTAEALETFIQKETEYLQSCNPTNALGEITGNDFAAGVICGMNKVKEYAASQTEQLRKEIEDWKAGEMRLIASHNKVLEEWQQENASLRQQLSERENCAFCGWPKNDHRNGRCYHYSDEDTDYFYDDKFFQSPKESSPSQEQLKEDIDVSKKPDFAKATYWDGLFMFTTGSEDRAAMQAANHVWDTYVSPLQARIKELEQEVADRKKKYKDHAIKLDDIYIKKHLQQEDEHRDEVAKLEARIKELEAGNADKWISVKERLPLTDEYVLITDGSEVWVGNYERSGYRGRSQWGQAYVGCSMVDDTKVTHWQPLPSKPKD